MTTETKNSKNMISLDEFVERHETYSGEWKQNSYDFNLYINSTRKQRFRMRQQAIDDWLRAYWPYPDCYLICSKKGLATHTFTHKYFMRDIIAPYTLKRILEHYVDDELVRENIIEDVMRNDELGSMFDQDR